MKPEDEWTIVYYTTENGTNPVEEFLSGLDNKARSRLVEAIILLKQLNIRAKEPLVKHIEDKLWELRKEINTNAYRILYVTFTGKCIVLLHAFTKKTQKTPKREIEKALRRLAHYEETHGGKQ